MALLGAIRPGTIAGLIRLLSQGEAVATLICERGPTRVDFHFSNGKIESMEVNQLPSERGLDIVTTWETGVYRLIKGRIERGYGLFESSDRGAGARGHVLILSADVGLTGMAENTLEQIGYQVSVAPSSAQAVETLAQISPTLIILDTEPGDNELTAAEQLRDHDHGRELPVIALTRMPDASLARSLHLLGLSSITKPVSPEALVSVVQQEIQMYHMRSSRDWSALAVPAETPEVAADIVDLLLFEEVIPSLDSVFDKSSKLGIKIALGEASPETVALFDLFDGRNSLREIIAANPKLGQKVKFLASYMVKTGLLETVAEAPKTQTVIDEETGEISEVPLPSLAKPAPRERPDQPYFTAVETLDLADALHSIHGPDAQWAKLLSLGLPPAYRGAFADTLRFISSVQSNFIKRGASVAIPALPEYEVARILMRSDLLMSIHDVEDESRLIDVTRLLGGNVWGFVFFVSMHQRSAMTYLRSLVHSVTRSYQRPYVVNLLNVGASVEADAIQLVEDTLEIDRKGVVGVWNIQKPEAVIKMIDQLIQLS